ncbi:MAG: helix-turn-helix transcriptional regulator [Ruminococcaceae bacterium]|nr:helix-turn-helix transcriptional regulator [Oscillospiraceae bacterium]
MNYSEIIKSIIDTKNVSVEELAYFTATSKKKVNKWLSGEAEPKKRNVKLLASFCGVTEALLKEGIISPIHLSKIDENGESHEPTLTEIEEENFKLYQKFFKTRLPYFKLIVIPIQIFLVILTILCLFINFSDLAISILYTTEFSKQITLFLGAFAPIFIVLMQFLISNFVARKPYLYDKSVLYTAFIPITIATLLNSVVSVCFGYLHIFSCILNLCSIIALIIVLKTLLKNKLSFQKRRLNEIIINTPWFFNAFSLFLSLNILPENDETFNEIAFPVLFANCAIMAGMVMLTGIFSFYYDASHPKKYFLPLPAGKKISKKRIIISTVATVLAIAMLSTTLFFTNKYASRVLIEYFNSIVKNTIVETNNPIPTDFNNYDVVFENEKVKTLDFEAFTIKVPEEYIEQKNEYEYSCILKTENSTILIMLPNYDIYDPTNSDLYNLTKMAMKNAESEEDIEKIKKTENALIEQFGFAPTSHIDYERFYKILNENKDFALTRELFAGITLFYSMFSIYSIGNYSDFKEIYCNNGFEGLFYQAHKEEGFVSYTFHFGVPQKSDTAYGFSINFENTEPDMELIYKIMNSIEFK